MQLDRVKVVRNRLHETKKKKYDDLRDTSVDDIATLLIRNYFAAVSHRDCMIP